MSPKPSVTRLRVRYSESDRMGTFYNSRVLEWFECGRTEWLRGAGVPYTRMESQGAFLPLVEAHVNYQGRAQYDDELKITTTAVMSGKARIRFDIEIVHAAAGRPVARGYTVHAITDRSGKPIRPPAWLTQAFDNDTRPGSK